MREAISRPRQVPLPSDPRQPLPVPRLPPPPPRRLVVAAAVTVAVLTTRVIAVAQTTVVSVLFHEIRRPPPTATRPHHQCRRPLIITIAVATGRCIVPCRRQAQLPTGAR